MGHYTLSSLKEHKSFPNLYILVDKRGIGVHLWFTTNNFWDGIIFMVSHKTRLHNFNIKRYFGWGNFLECIFHLKYHNISWLWYSDCWKSISNILYFRIFLHLLGCRDQYIFNIFHRFSKLDINLPGMFSDKFKTHLDIVCNSILAYSSNYRDNIESNWIIYLGICNFNTFCILHCPTILSDNTLVSL